MKSFSTVIIFGLCVCISLISAQENTFTLCTDGIDNDMNNLVDCEDPTCFLIVNGPCTVCQRGGTSYADTLLDSHITCSANSLFPIPEEALGSPNFSGIATLGNYVSLGESGWIELGFLDNLLSNSGDDKFDLWVFEIGMQVENTLIAVRPYNQFTIDALQSALIKDEDGDGFYNLDIINGAKSGLDIDKFIPNADTLTLFFDAVKISDVAPSNCTNLTPGADIDAVCAISSISLVGVEDCENGIDDNDNGLADLNDPQCPCGEILPTSLVPNPSFEIRSCCPVELGELSCTAFWQPQSSPNTDYFNTCGLISNPILSYDVPLPLPDGDGVVGLSDGTSADVRAKKYIGSCLKNNLMIDSIYVMEFSVGFHRAEGSLDFDIGVYGTKECSSLPFTSNGTMITCPTDNADWELISNVSVSGFDEWEKVHFEFQASDSYGAICIGPSCELNDSFDLNPYFFIDRIVLAQPRFFDLPISEEGQICENTLEFSVNIQNDETVQWYKDGVALVGKTMPTIEILNESSSNGSYKAVVMGEDYCIVSEALLVVANIVEASVYAMICEGDVFTIGEFQFDSPGEYIVTVPSESISCDSLITLNLVVIRQENFRLNFEICPGETIEFAGVTYSTPGEYMQAVDSNEECPVIATVVITEQENSSTTIDTIICQGDFFIFNGSMINQSGQYSHSIPQSSGCDSLIILNISFLTPQEEVQSVKICDGDTININNELYFQEGSFHQSVMSSNDCDISLTVNVSFYPESSAFINVEVCSADSVVVNGEVYNTSGDFTQVLSAANGCDSLLFINVLKVDPELRYDTLLLCLNTPLTYLGNTISQEGDYVFDFLDLNGCESNSFVCVKLDEECETCGGTAISSNLLRVNRLGHDYYRVTVNNLEQELLEYFGTLNEVKTLYAIFSTLNEELELTSPQLNAIVNATNDHSSIIKNEGPSNHSMDMLVNDLEHHFDSKFFTEFRNLAIFRRSTAHFILTLSEMPFNSSATFQN